MACTPTRTLWIHICRLVKFHFKTEYFKVNFESTKSYLSVSLNKWMHVIFWRAGRRALHSDYFSHSLRHSKMVWKWFWRQSTRFSKRYLQVYFEMFIISNTSSQSQSQFFYQKISHFGKSSQGKLVSISSEKTLIILK